ncbi:hypothetical protein KUW18_09950 [Halomonas sp. DP5Y7-2]|uniref:hypothetical protein n=1 Tax=Halomonas sp. DP5Y7-2 TaxID=2859076 RepID=UPI001C99EAEA|nr:hypothetical protein [Halomonas sp. DP5Y7-2]MBY5984411.1 hypothetical protein [Halomonas sp. DP5Y7-2]
MTTTNEATLDGLRKRLEQVQAVRDALAAQLDAVFGVVLRPLVATFGEAEAMAEARRIAMNQPQDILARRDARMKAEALHRSIVDLEAMIDPCNPVIEYLNAQEQGYRQQAEGGVNE